MSHAGRTDLEEEDEAKAKDQDVAKGKVNCGTVDCISWLWMINYKFGGRVQSKKYLQTR